MSLIYKNIEERRKELGIKKMDFYRMIEMSHVGFSQAIERNSIKISTLLKIAEVLKTTPEKILSLPGESVKLPQESDKGKATMDANSILLEVLKSLKLSYQSQEKQIALIEEYLNGKITLK